MYFILNPYDYEHTILADDTIRRRIKEVIVRENLQSEFSVLLSACEGEDTRWNDPYQTKTESNSANKTKNVETNKNNNKMWNKRNSEVRNSSTANISNRRSKSLEKENKEQSSLDPDKVTNSTTKKRKRVEEENDDDDDDNGDNQPTSDSDER
jgi:hypothetical protein